MFIHERGQYRFYTEYMMRGFTHHVSGKGSWRWNKTFLQIQQHSLDRSITPQLLTARRMSSPSRFWIFSRWESLASLVGLSVLLAACRLLFLSLRSSVYASTHLKRHFVRLAPKPSSPVLSVPRNRCVVRLCAHEIKVDKMLNTG